MKNLFWFVVLIGAGYWAYRTFVSDVDGDGLLRLDRYEDKTVDVWFYFPDGREYMIGTVRGAFACGSLARSYAADKGGGRTDYDWSYVCCTVEDDSSCKHKIR
jgi:hypothetical protein